MMNLLISKKVSNKLNLITHFLESYYSTLEHVGQTSLDLNWPWKRSTIKESFLILCLCHASSATTCKKTPTDIDMQKE